MKAQVACLLHTSKSEFTLNFVDVHKQTGSNDCGLFSIAYAVALCLGKNPSTLVFDQPKVHSHLLRSKIFHCFQSEVKEEKTCKLKGLIE